MHVEIPQIFWHGNRDRIMSIDFYPNTNFLVTCGAEAENKMFVKLWEITLSPSPAQTFLNNQQPQPTTNTSTNPQEQQIPTILSDEPESSFHIFPKFINELSGAHNSTVNIARFSPNGMYLATGGDDCAIVIWVQKNRPVSFGSSEEKVTWCNYKILRGHLGDVYDLCWSPDSKYLISGSVDNTAILWNIEKAKGIQKFTDHNHFVQGVSWDPRNKYIVTQSSDKSVRFYKKAITKQDTKFFYLNQMKRFEKVNDNTANQEQVPQIEKIDKNKMLIDDDVNNNNIMTTNTHNNNNNKTISYHYYFADETQCPTFVRRHSWSPDGSILLLVSGMLKNETSNEMDFVVWGLSRKDLSHPLFYIPTLDKSSICVKFCPFFFKKETTDESSSTPALLDLPYTMIFAIATIDSVFIYGTDSIQPRYVLTNIHFQSITDLAWNGADTLAIASSDGYITFCLFEKGELGIQIQPSEIQNDDKLKSAYEMYCNIDITKNVLSTSSCVTSIIKTKRKKEERQLNDNCNVQEANKMKSVVNNNNEKVKDENEKINTNEDIEMKDVLS